MEDVTISEIMERLRAVQYKVPVVSLRLSIGPAHLLSYKNRAQRAELQIELVGERHFWRDVEESKADILEFIEKLEARPASAWDFHW